MGQEREQDLHLFAALLDIADVIDNDSVIVR
jgi:hypothetical protein